MNEYANAISGRLRSPQRRSLEMLQAVIFDMDGVLVESEPFFLQVEKRIFQELGICVNEQEHRSFLGTTFEYMWAALIRKHGLDRSPAELAKLHQERYLESIRSGGGIAWVPGAQQLVDELRAQELKLAVVSSSTREIVKTVLGHLAITGCFHATVAGDEVAHGKPHPEPFLRAAAMLGFPPECCAVIEDSANGVLAAKAAGMKCVGYLNPHSGEQDLSGADWIVDNLHRVDTKSLRVRGCFSEGSTVSESEIPNPKSEIRNNQKKTPNSKSQRRQELKTKA